MPKNCCKHQDNQNLDSESKVSQKNGGTGLCIEFLMNMDDIAIHSFCKYLNEKCKSDERHQVPTSQVCKCVQ